MMLASEQYAHNWRVRKEVLGASGCSWSPPPETLALGSNEIHVWRAALNCGAARVHNLLQTLSTDERAKARRFYFQQDREHFIVARGLLRVILGRYLVIDPGQLRICYSPSGKPSLTRECGGEALRFNVSHSHGLALYAIAHGRELGVDLERIRPELADAQLAEHFFSLREVAMLRAVPTSLRQEAFFHCWTRKEAYIKARGEGLACPLGRFDVSLVPGEPAALLSTRDDPPEASRWTLRELFPGPDYVAAIAVEGHDWRLQCWHWPGA